MFGKSIADKFITLSVLILLLFNSCNNNRHIQPDMNSMFMANNQHTGKSSSTPVKSAPYILWKVKTEGQVISSPVFADGLVYIGSEDCKLYAINAKSGIIVWTFKTNGPVNSTPLVAKDKVLFLSQDGFFYALNQTNGKLIWKFKTGGESKFKVKDYYNKTFQPDFWDFYLSSAAVKDDFVYVGSSDSNVYALNIDSGEKLWKYKTGGSIHSSPAISDNSLVIGSWDSKIYCLDALTGAEKWTYTTGRDTANYIWLGIQASPTIDNGVVYIGSRDAKFYAISVETGDTLWTKNQFDRSWMPSTAAIGNDNLFTGSSDSFSFFSIDKKTGDINYKVNTKAYTFSSPAIDNEMAYIGSANGRLYGIELKSGTLQWEFQTTGSKSDTINVFKKDGEYDIEKLKILMAGIQNMPAQSALFQNIFVSTGAILSSPLIFDQVIYFGSSDGYIYAITDMQKED